jgi:NAD+---dinitrogen-reductase ADP-D-ribosyltransferase
MVDPVAFRGNQSNLIRVSTGVIQSVDFNDDPTELHIAGAREDHAVLFERLEAARGQEDAAEIFQTYLAELFGLPQGFVRQHGTDGHGHFKSSYLRLMKGWMFDANNAEGAVLKGWVESRFGLLPTWHRDRLDRVSSEAWANYVAQKLGSRFNNNAVFTQLDLLYEFCQWSVRRLFPARKHLQLYRGVNDFAEHMIIERPDKRTAVVRLNNLVSFTDDRALASQFGDLILTARVPLVKLLFFRELLPRYPFQGEGEYLVIGGDYRVSVAVL